MADNIPGQNIQNPQQTKAALLVGGLFAVAMFLIVAVVGILAIGDNNISVRDAQVTNVTDTAFTLTWVSESPYVGSVVYKEGASWPALFAQSGAKVSFDDRDVELDKDGNYVTVTTGAKERFTHHVTIRNLKPETEYSFRVGGRINGKSAEVTTAKTRALIEDIKTPDPGYGKVEGMENSDSFVVFGVASRSDQGLWSTIVSTKGTYSIDVTPLSKDGKFDPREAIANLQSKNDDILVANFAKPGYKPFDTIISSSELEKKEPLGGVFGRISAESNEFIVKTNVRANIRPYLAPSDGNPEAATGGPKTVVDPAKELKVEPEAIIIGGARWYRLTPATVSELRSSGLEEGTVYLISDSVVTPQNPETNTSTPSPTNIPQVVPAEAVSDCPVNTFVIPNSGNIRIRSGAGTDTLVLGVLPDNPGQGFEVKDCIKNSNNELWYKIDLGQRQGFTASWLVSEVGQAIQSIVDNPITIVPEQETQESQTPQPIIDNSFVAVGNAYWYKNILNDSTLEECLSVPEGTVDSAPFSHLRTVRMYFRDNTRVISGSSSRNTEYQPGLSFPSKAIDQKIYYSDPSCSAGVLVNGIWIADYTVAVDFGGPYYYEHLVVDCGGYPTNDPTDNLGACHPLQGDRLGRYSQIIIDEYTNDGKLVPASYPPYAFYDYAVGPMVTVFRDKASCDDSRKIVLDRPGAKDCGNARSVRTTSQNNSVDKGLLSFSRFASAATPGDSEASKPRVLGAGTDQSLEVTESGRYAFFRDGERIAEQDVVVGDGQVRVRMFTDSNANGVRDANEEYFTDYSQISIAKEASAEEFRLISGWNLIHLPLIDTRTDGNVDSAGELIDYWNGQGADIKHVARYRNGQFQMFSKRESGTEYSTDFDLIPGEGLFILNLAGNTNVTFSGNRFESSVPVKLNQGWNLVGIMAPGQSLNSEAVLKKAQLQGFTADTISQFEGGTYQSVISKDDTIFGNNFNIVDKRGYFIRVESGGGQSFDPGK